MEMDPERSKLAALARRIVAEGVAPACAVGCAAFGVRGGWRDETGGAADLVFDLASVTKPMTAVALARAGVDRRTPLASLVHEAKGTPSGDVPIELFLAHRAGLEGRRDLADATGAPEPIAAALREAACARRPEVAGTPLPRDGFPPLYSDLGYVLAGVALARATGARDAGEAIERWVLAPLGMTDRAGTARGLAQRGIARRFAPTEDVPARGGLVVGAVHDENAWWLTGAGGSGHAGIFGTVDAVVAFGKAVLDALAGRPTPIGGAELDWLVRPRSGGTLRAGFDGKSKEGSSAGALAGPASFGHLGFTGTSLWLDPDAQAVVVLLTNRVCPSRDNLAIRAARPDAHDVLWARARELRLDRNAH